MDWRPNNRAGGRRPGSWTIGRASGRVVCWAAGRSVRLSGRMVGREPRGAEVERSNKQTVNRASQGKATVPRVLTRAKSICEWRAATPPTRERERAPRPEARDTPDALGALHRLGVALSCASLRTARASTRARPDEHIRGRRSHVGFQRFPLAKAQAKQRHPKALQSCEARVHELPPKDIHSARASSATVAGLGKCHKRRPE